MKVSQNCIDIIKKYEGCKLKAYVCPAGKLTIGYGHTKGVTSTMKITKVKAEELLKEDIVIYEQLVNKYNKYDFNQNQFDSLVSFAYNVGSIDQLTANGTRSKEVIGDKILLYDKANGESLAGLTKRRIEERNLYIKECEENKVSEIQVQHKEETTVTYVLTANLKVRSGAGTNYKSKKYTELTDNAKENADRHGILKKGTKVTVYEVVLVGNDIWGKIPSGYIALVYRNKQYCSRVN